MAQECDINAIVARNAVKGFQKELTGKEHYFADVSNIPDYRGAMTAIARANEEFARLPSYIRNRFDNDPAKLIDFVNDKRNRKEAEKLGLVKIIENGVEYAPKKEEPPAGNEPAKNT